MDRIIRKCAKDKKKKSTVEEVSSVVFEVKKKTKVYFPGRAIEKSGIH